MVSLPSGCGPRDGHVRLQRGVGWCWVTKAILLNMVGLAEAFVHGSHVLVNSLQLMLPLA